MYRAIQFIVLTAVVLFGMSTVAQAGHIPMLKNTTTGAVIFDTDFELPNNVVGSQPGTPDVGTWTISGTTTDSALIADSTVTGYSAYEGGQFLNIVAPTSHSPPRVIALADGIAGNSGDSEWIQWTLAFNIDGDLSFNRIAIVPKDANGTLLGGQFSTHADGGVMSWLPSGSGTWVALNETYTPGAWNTLVVKHQNGTTVWSASINGATFETLAGVAGNNWCGFSLEAASQGVRNGSFDAVVPEPSTLALLATGLIGLLCYAWRKRK